MINTKGDFVDDPTDPGGPTNRGISWEVWTSYSKSVLNIDPALENLKNLTQDQAKSMYKTLYWDKVLCDQIVNENLRYQLFDFYVNAGGNAVKELQRTLKKLGLSVAVDGVMGPSTLQAINQFGNQLTLYNTFKESRQNYYNRITQRNIDLYLKKHPDASATEITKKTFKRFIDGWTNRVNHFADKTEENQKNVNC